MPCGSVKKKSGYNFVFLEILDVIFDTNLFYW